MMTRKTEVANAKTVLTILLERALRNCFDASRKIILSIVLSGDDIITKYRNFSYRPMFGL